MKRGIACVVALTEIAVAPIRGLAADRVKDGAPFGAALAAIDGAKMLKDIDVLASDDFEGRSPGTHGEAVCYEQSHHRRCGFDALPKMRAGPSKSACRSRLQTATSGGGQESLS
jgi:hypothetical protein